MQTERLTYEDLAEAIANRSYRNDLMRAFFTSEGIESREVIPEADIASQILYELDNEDPELDNWVADYGMPCWECATTKEFSELFNVSIPFYQNNELTAVLAFLSTDNETLYIQVQLKTYNRLYE
ncbi:MAG: hypothetical protein ACI9XO_003751 [Paraglaciecola sp.]|jgi:hypothetical protein